MELRQPDVLDEGAEQGLHRALVAGVIEKGAVEGESVGHHGREQRIHVDEWADEARWSERQTFELATELSGARYRQRGQENRAAAMRE